MFSRCFILMAAIVFLCACAAQPASGDRIKDGTYSIDVTSSSSMFRVTDAQLTVAGGKMTAVLTLSGTAYEKLYMGTGEQALADTDDKCVYFVETPDGEYTYEIPVAALDQEIDVAAWSIRKETWYDRTLVFVSESISTDAFAAQTSDLPDGPLPDGPLSDGPLSDGRYEIAVALSGGSGKASVASPAELNVTGGAAVATIVWSSPHYDYMLSDGIYYYPINIEETDKKNTVFQIPVILDRDLAISAQTSAMSTPRVIDYQLRLDSATASPFTGQTELAAPAKAEENITQQAAAPASRDIGGGREPQSSLPLLYAENFAVDFFSDGYTLIRISDGSRFLVVPPGTDVPDELDADIFVLQQPIQNIYLAATSAMSLFDALDAISHIKLSGTAAEDWHSERATAAMKAGDMLFAGKYSAPDYELILSQKCQLAIESRMIYHAPEVKEKLIDLGIPVLVDQSSFEPHPLGRAEWVKLYAALLGKEAEGEKLFDEQTAYLNAVEDQNNTGLSVAFFNINTAGKAVVRQPADYVTKIIELAGGKYAFQKLGDSETASGTLSVEMEAFYASAMEADYFIYNSILGGEVSSLEELIGKNELLADCKAVRNGNVWCVNSDFYQEPLRLGLMLEDVRRMLTDNDPALTKLNILFKLS